MIEQWRIEYEMRSEELKDLKWVFAVQRTAPGLATTDAIRSVQVSERIDTRHPVDKNESVRVESAIEPLEEGQSGIPVVLVVESPQNLAE